VTLFNGDARLARVASTAVLLFLLSFTSMTTSPVDAQPSKRTPIIGILGTNPPTTSQGVRIWEGFTLALRERGWVDGKTLRIESRWSNGRAERFPDLAAELVRLDVDVLLTNGSQATKAAKEATGTIPIVFIGVANPVGAGYVASLARPGGNVTGVTNQLSDLAEKWLQLAKDVVPRLRHIGIMWNPADAGSALSFKDSQDSYTRLGIKLTSVPVTALEDFEGGFEILSRERPEFLIVHPSPVLARHRQRVAEFATRHRLPTSSGSRSMTEDGAILMSYGPDVADLLRQGVAYVDKILRGARPADLPIEQPTKFELVINLKTAKALGLTIPPSLLQRADQVIE
jgi:putative ABC transport system substrate-binding protein